MSFFNLAFSLNDVSIAKRVFNLEKKMLYFCRICINYAVLICKMLCENYGQGTEIKVMFIFIVNVLFNYLEISRFIWV